MSIFSYLHQDLQDLQDEDIWVIKGRFDDVSARFRNLLTEKRF